MTATRSGCWSGTTAATTAASIDRLPLGIQRALEVQRGDLKDPDAVRRAVEGRAWVFHLGALIAIPYSYQNPYDVVQTNVLGTAHVLDACRTSRALERLVLTSTSEVYGTAQYVPIDEQHPLRGQSPYAATKIAADALGESYHRAFGLPLTILRPFNTFGPRQSARAIVPTIISQALTRPVRAAREFGAARDLTYVKDTVSGFVAIAGCDAALGRAVNIGRGDDLSIGELVERIAARLGRPLRVESETARSGRPRARSAASWPGPSWRANSGAGRPGTRLTRHWMRPSPMSARTSSRSGSMSTRRDLIEIVPSHPMTLQEYEAALSKIVLVPA